jgi:hypothetical protein
MNFDARHEWLRTIFIIPESLYARSDSSALLHENHGPMAWPCLQERRLESLATMPRLSLSQKRIFANASGSLDDVPSGMARPSIDERGVKTEWVRRTSSMTKVVFCTVMWRTLFQIKARSHWKEFTLSECPQRTERVSRKTLQSHASCTRFGRMPPMDRASEWENFACQLFV